MDKFIQIVDKNGLRPDEIQKIRVKPHPIVQFRYYQGNELRTEEDYAFHLPYLLGCAANKVKPARWLDRNVREDDRIKEFIRRVEFHTVIDEIAFGLAMLQDPVSRLAAIEVTTDRGTFKEQCTYVKGSWRPEEYRTRDDELTEKFIDNCSTVLVSNRIDEVSKTIWSVEQLASVRDLTRLLRC